MRLRVSEAKRAMERLRQGGGGCPPPSVGDTGVILWKACPRLRRPPEALCLGHTNMLTTQRLTFLQSKQTSQEDSDMLNRYLAQPITTRRKRKGRKEWRRRSIHRHYG